MDEKRGALRHAVNHEFGTLGEFVRGMFSMSLEAVLYPLLRFYRLERRFE